MITFLHILYIALALLGLSVVICVHELGHYWMARLVGMRVEVFSIGFGKAIFSFKRKETTWTIRMIPFGGYVKIAGMDHEKGKEFSTEPGTYFAKKPWQRMLVAFAGPFMNVVFTLTACSILWVTGGREQPYSRFTSKIGLMDKTSEVYQKDIRPGDKITLLNNNSYHDFQDMLFHSASKDKELRLRGYKMDYYNQVKTAYDYKFVTYEWHLSNFSGLTTIGIFAPAKELVYHKLASPLNSFFGLEKAGLRDKDRILWVDGELIFSELRLNSLLNENISILTIKREDKTFIAKVQRYLVKDLKIDSIDLQDLDDWRHSAGLKGKITDLYFIPYFLNEYCIIDTAITPLQEKSIDIRNPFEVALKPGDKIIAVDGQPVYSDAEILRALQTHKMIMVILREKPELSLWTDADQTWNNFSGKTLMELLNSLGTDKPLESICNLHMLTPITFKKLEDFPFDADSKRWVYQQIEATGVPQNQLDEVFNQIKVRPLVDFPMTLHDRAVIYNPDPITEIKSMLQQMIKMFVALFSGNMSPKMIAGPIGMIKMMEGYFQNGLKETLYFLGFISMNLGFLNILPIPALDGGHVVFNLIEMFRRKPIKPKTIEILSMIFFGLFIVLLIYVTYQDIIRIMKGFF
jgi:regulator of sigma E protease